MSAPTVTVNLVSVVPNLVLPQPASAHTRAHVPPGYGVQEPCLPCTAARALGFLIPSPIWFGLCPLPEVPGGCHAFRSPLDRPEADGRSADSRVLYVADDEACRFRGNAYELAGILADDSPPLREPGLSFSTARTSRIVSGSICPTSGAPRTRWTCCSSRS